MTVYSMTTPTAQQNQHAVNAILTTVLVIGAAVDAIITSSLCYNLFKECRKSMPRRSMIPAANILADTKYALD